MLCSLCSVGCAMLSSVMGAHATSSMMVNACHHCVRYQVVLALGYCVEIKKESSELEPSSRTDGRSECKIKNK